MHTVRITRSILAASFVSFAACGGRESVSPSMPASSPTLDVAQDVAVSQVACVIAWTQPNGAVYVAELGREEMPVALPRLETARRASPSGRRLLRIGTTEWAGDGRHSLRVGASCLTPSTFSNDALAQALRAKGTLILDAARAGAVPAALHASGSLGLTASDALNGAITRRLGRAMVRRAAVRAAPSLSYSGVSPGYLPTIVITASGSSLITNSSDIWYTLHYARVWSIGGLGVEEQYAPGYCASATERWTVLNEELQSLLQAESDINDAIAAMAGNTTSLTCQRQTSSRKTCVDFFIMSATTFVTGFGDGRTFDRNAPYGASRVQIYLDLDNVHGEYHLTSSTAYIPLPIPGSWTTPGFVYTADPYPHSPRDMYIQAVAPGQVKLVVEAYNGFCSYSSRYLCPAINAEITFTKQADGRWTTGESSINRDNYPSLGIYQQEADGTFSTIYEDAEGHWSALFGVRRMIDKLRQEMSKTIAGCQLE